MAKFSVKIIKNTTVINGLSLHVGSYDHGQRLT